jgi:hypothetical protein
MKSKHYFRGQIDTFLVQTYDSAALTAMYCKFKVYNEIS